MFRKLPKTSFLFQFDVMLSSAGCLFVVVVVSQSFFKFLIIYWDSYHANQQKTAMI